MSNRDTLITCEVCGNQVATSATVCPHCGANLLLQKEGTVVIYRKPTLTGLFVAIKVELNDKEIGQLHRGESVTLTLAKGPHHIRVSGILFSRSMDITIQGGEQISLTTYFSDWAIGNTLRLNQD